MRGLSIKPSGPLSESCIHYQKTGPYLKTMPAKRSIIALLLFCFALLFGVYVLFVVRRFWQAPLDESIRLPEPQIEHHDCHPVIRK